MIGTILSSFSAAVNQSFDPRFRRVLLLGVGLTVALLAAIYAGVLWLLNVLVPETLVLPLIGEVTWINDLASGASILVMLVASVFLMVPVASAFTGLFLEQVADAVEDRHYPSLPPAKGASILDGLRDALGFLGVLIVANLLALVLYLVFAPLAPVIFWGLNGFLLGREYFQLVALRRLPPDQAKAMRSRHAGTIWIAGILMALPLTVPIVNLFVPVLGVATFTHLFHRLGARG
jgi:uncharacterized protein involved in cysteine biosynthesis